MKINAITDLIINGDYEKLLEVGIGNRAIKITPITRAKVKKHIELAQQERLEEEKAKLSKSAYAIEHGSVARTEERIEKLQYVLKELGIKEDELCKKQDSKALRVDKQTLDRNNAKFIKHNQTKDKEELVIENPVNQVLEDQQELDRIGNLIKQRGNVMDSNTQVTASAPVQIPIEDMPPRTVEQEIKVPSIATEPVNQIPATPVIPFVESKKKAEEEKQISIVTPEAEQQTIPIVAAVESVPVEERKVSSIEIPEEKTVEAVVEKQAEIEEKTNIIENDDAIVTQKSDSSQLEEEEKQSTTGSIDRIVKNWTILNNQEAEAKAQSEQAIEAQKTAEEKFLQITQQIQEAVTNRQAMITEYQQKATKAKATADDINSKIIQLQQMLEGTMEQTETEKDMTGLRKVA